MRPSRDKDREGSGTRESEQVQNWESFEDDGDGSEGRKRGRE